MTQNRMSSLVNRATVVGEDAVTVLHDVVKKAGARASGIGERAIKDGQCAERFFERRIGDRNLAVVLVAGAIGYGIARLFHHR